MLNPHSCFSPQKLTGKEEPSIDYQMMMMTITLLGRRLLLQRQVSDAIQNEREREKEMCVTVSTEL